MYAKLALSNTIKALKDYIIYFITITLCVSLFYAFLSLSSSQYTMITEDTYNFDSLKQILKVSSYVITALLAFLVQYVTKYMMSRRQKEFALYILLGTEQTKVALLFFIETLIIGIISIFLGIFVGTIFSQLVTAFVLLTIEQPIVFHFQLYFDSIVLTFLFFLGMFCIIGLYNMKKLSKQKLIHLLNANKKSEFQFRKNKYVYLVAFVISVLLFLFSGLLAYEIFHMPTLSFPEKFKKATLAMVLFLPATYLFFYSISFILIIIKEKCHGFQYKGTNLFFINSLTFKIKTTPFLMATISLSLLGAVISFLITLVLAQWTLGYLDYRIPFDIQFASKFQVEEGSTLLSFTDSKVLDYQTIINELEAKNIKSTHCVVENYYLNQIGTVKAMSPKADILAISLSDFNELRTMLGYEPISLQSNTYTTQWNITTPTKYIDDFIDSNATIRLGTKDLSLGETPVYKESIGEYIYPYPNEFFLVFPDEQCKNLPSISSNLFFCLQETYSFQEIANLQEDVLTPWIVSQENTLPVSIIQNAKGIERNIILNFSLGMRIVGIYLGVVLLMIALTVLTLQQLSDSIESKERFFVLKKLGISAVEIRKIILKQISVYFLIPITIAIIEMIIFTYGFFFLYKEPILSYVGLQQFILNIVVAACCMLAIYLCYFLATYFSFKQNIEQENGK